MPKYEIQNNYIISICYKKHEKRNHNGYENQLIKLWTKVHRFFGECDLARAEMKGLEVTRLHRSAAARWGFERRDFILNHTSISSLYLFEGMVESNMFSKILKRQIFVHLTRHGNTPSNGCKTLQTLFTWNKIF